MIVTCPYCNSRYRFKLSISEFKFIGDYSDTTC